VARESPSDRHFPRGLRDWLPEIVLLLVTTGAGLWAAGRWLDPSGDAGYFWSLAYRLSKGEKLYRDIYIQYTPLSPYLLAAGARVVGLSARYYLLANWIPAILAGLLLLRCGRFFLSTLERLALVGVLLFSSLLVAGRGHLILPYSLAVVHALALSIGALLLVRPQREQSTTRVLLAGCLAGLAFCCKQEVGVAAFLALAAAPLAGQARPLAWLTRLIAGFIAAILPVAIFVLSSASIESLQRDSHLWPLAPIPPTTTSFLMHWVAGFGDPHWPGAVLATVLRDLGRVALIALLALLLARERKRSVWLRVTAVLLGVGLWWLFRRQLPAPLPSLSLSMAAAFSVAILAILLKDAPHRPFLISFAIFAGLVGTRTAFGRGVSGPYSGPGHFASALTSVLFLVVFLPPLLVGEGRAASYLRTLLTLVLLSVSWWQTARSIRELRFPSRVSVQTREGQVYADPNEAVLFNAIARDSTAGERALIIPESYGIDALFHLENVSPLVTAFPGWLDLDLERRLIKRLDESPPDLVVLLKRPVREFGSEPFGVGYGLLLADWCSRNYQVVDSSPLGKILRKRREDPQR
jgi:hypothetical protein